MRKVYLDNVAAAPLLPEVREAMLPFIGEVFGNPQSLHSWGDGAREAVENAREKVAALIGGSAEEIIFTSCGTESNNLAVRGLARARSDKGKHVVISSVEHFSVMNVARTLEKEGFEITIVPVDGYGMVDPDQVLSNIRPDTILVSIMHANGEVGTIQPVAAIAGKLPKDGPVFHTDAVASTGNIPVNVKEMGVNALSLAGGQFNGPRGGAALWLKRGTRILPLMDGGVQENGRRPGTEDVPAIVGLGKAAEIAMNNLPEKVQRFSRLRDMLIEGVLGKIVHSILTGHPVRRLPGYASFCLQFIEGESILMLLDSHGIAAASGSACTSRALKASHVLLAMGLSHELSQGSTLFTIGLDTTEDDIDYVVGILPQVVERLRQMSPLYSKFLKEQKG
ncbi:MAG: aminotransferase class V-fold PLP-dependent enzyme [Dehalococcoidia bacterium]|nr:aminotransferase class V-fold PLP-dependent enzyme [Dehalococcoidia bacterium]